MKAGLGQMKGESGRIGTWCDARGCRLYYRSYFYIIQLFYCPPANYTILTMFQNNPADLHPARATRRHNGLAPPPCGPFLIERVANLRRQTRRREKEWGCESHLRYLACLQAFGRELGMCGGREGWTPFKRMANFIRSRNSNQCRIHHKNMLREYHSVQGILTAHASLLRQQAPAFRTYVQELASPRPSDRDDRATNIRSRVLKSVIIDREKAVPVGATIEEAGQGKKGEDCLPTDVAYPDQVINSAFNNRRMGGYLQFCEPALQFMGENHLSQGSQVDSEQKKKQWEQCHQLFLAWTSKLHSLLYS